MNSRELKDYFFMNVQPIISSFPLESEGKKILKEKIQKELNIFLSTQKVEGQVIDVNITDIIAH